MSTILQLQAKQDHLEKIAATRDPIKALSEFVWNALDADAQNVSIDFPRNALGSMDAIRIADDGTGITEEQAKSAFRDLGDSWKRTAPRTPIAKRAVHGKEGRGRLRFYSLADTASWQSTYKSEKQLHDIGLIVHATALATTHITDPSPSSNKHTGTTVELTALKNSLEWLSGNLAQHEITSIFAPYLLQYPNVTISYNGRKIDTSETVALEIDLPQRPLVGPSRTIKDLRLKIIEWRTADGGRRINLGQEGGVILGSIPASVTAPDFNFSAYAYSSFFQEIADQGLLELGELNDPDYTFVLNSVRSQLSDYFRKRQSERAGTLIDELKKSGAYPYEGEPQSEVETRERQVFEIATYTVASYSKDFKRAESSVQRLALILMKEAIRHNPDSLTHILSAVVKLPKARQDEFASLLEKTELGNIISASNLISERIVTLEVLKGIVFDPKFRNTVKERGELDILVRDNTWLFGESFHITIPEQGLTRVMQRVALDLGQTRKPGKVVKLDGKSGRIDQMLGRSVPHPDQDRREYLLIELKRPSLTLTKKELDQVEDYLLALSGQTDFHHTNTSWTLILVGGDYDVTVKSRITQAGRPIGLSHVSDNAKIWVKTWAEIIRECEGRLRFVQDRLKIGVAAEEIETRIADLRSAVLKTEAIVAEEGRSPI